MPKIAPYAKMYAALVGSVATALSALYVDGPFGKALTTIAVVATTIATFTFENKPSIKRGEDGTSVVEVCAVLTLIGVLLLLCGKSFV